MLGNAARFPANKVFISEPLNTLILLRIFSGFASVCPGYARSLIG